jgi:hypothetical protein
MRKLLMPTLGDMGQPGGRARDLIGSDYRSLLPKPEMKSPKTDSFQTPLLKTQGGSIFQGSPLLQSSAAQGLHAALAGTGVANPPVSAPLSKLRARSLPPGLIALIHAIVSDLESRPTSLLGLNPSRRDGIAAHLNRLAGGAGRPNLAAWLHTPRTPAESNALFSYFEEVALMTIGQALLLKRWSDKGLRPFRADHLGKLNFELSTALRPHVPLHREGFHLTRPNLYSWYSPPTLLQEELFRTLEQIEFRDESPIFLLELCTDGRRFFPDWPELLGYDSRFYQEASNELLRWSRSAPSAAVRRKVGFTPTLRLGQVTHGNSNEIHWIGCEEITFALLISEMIDLWWGPKAPPVWANSNALEAHSKEQLTLIAPGSKPGVMAMLSDMEACDFGWVAEERTVKASRHKTMIDGLPFYRKLRAPGTSLGTLQACVAITKIRPGGRLLWVREEPLTGDEGSEALSFLLGRGKLLAEIDLSHIEHSLPTRRPLFPRFIYVFERELNTETRLAHRPVRWLGQGAIKSHVEVALFLNDLLASVPSQTSSLPNLPTRANWKFVGQVSPLPQKEWMNRWPDPSCAESLSNLESLCRGTVPLATLATIRPVAKTSIVLGAGSGRAAGTTNSALDPKFHALFVEARPERREEGNTDGRRLEIRPFRELVPGMEYAGFAVHLRDESWIDPIRAYLQTAPIAQWLEHHAERRGDRWILSESLLKMLPIPERLSAAISREAANPELRSVAANLAKAPESILSLTSLTPELRYIVMSQALKENDWGLRQIRPFLNSENRIEWTKVLSLFRAQDAIPLTQHPLVRVVGAIPVNSPITKLDRLKSPQNGMLVMTETGALQKVVFEHRMLADMAWDQAKMLVHPTWGELVQLIRLPRTLEIAESAAGDILASFEALERKRVVLASWLAAGVPSDL